MSMTSRERWLAVLNHEIPDRVPTDYWATPEVTERLLRELQCVDLDEMYRRLHIDRPVGVGGRYVGPDIGNLWGLESVAQNYGTGVYHEVAKNPLAAATTVKEIEDYPWPKHEWYVFDNVGEALEKCAGTCIQGGSFEPFLQYCQLRGQEQALMDLVLNPEMAETALEKVFEYHYGYNERLFEAAELYERRGLGIVITYVAEDLGTQQSLLMSEAQVDTFIKPRMKKMIDLAHSHGIFAFHHSDGAVRPLLPGMIEIGIDVLNPVQWRCSGMDRRELKESFGDRLVFHGAMDNQETMPFGTVDDVRNEVRENIEILGRDGGYILAPCHNLQPITPTENIIAMYETAHAEGVYR